MPRRATAERRILAALERVLADGERFTAVGMQRLADEAGVARSTVYKHFADKSDLLIRSTAEATDELFAVAEAWVRAGHHTRASLELTLAAVIAQHRLHQGLFSAMEEVAAYDDRVAAFWRGRMDGFCAVLETALPPGVDAPVRARFIAWGVERLVFEHTETDGGDGDDRLAAGVAEAIWRLMEA